MADDIFNVQPPAWLTRIAQPADMSIASKVVGEVIGGLANTVGDSIAAAKEKRDNGDLTASWIKEFPSNIKTGLIQARLNMADPLGQMKAQSAGLQVGKQFLGLQEQQIAIDQAKNDLSMQQHDQTELGDWLKKFPTWESRQSAPAPTLFTPQFQKSWDGIMLQDTKTIQQRAITSSIKDFAKTVDEARRLGIDVGKYAQYMDKPVPTEIRQQLDKEIADKKGPAAPDIVTRKRSDGMMVDFYWNGREWLEVDKKGSTATTQKLTPAQKSRLDVLQKNVEELQKQVNDPKNADDVLEDIPEKAPGIFGLGGQKARKGLRTRLKEAQEQLNQYLSTLEQQPASSKPAAAGGFSFDDFQSWRSK